MSPSQERRHYRRRSTDDMEVPEGLERGLTMWIRLMFIHRGKLLALGMIVGSPLGYMVGCAGRMQAVDALTRRVTNVETDVVRLKESARLQSFLLCFSTPPGAPEKVMNVCRSILENGVAP